MIIDDEKGRKNWRKRRKRGKRGKLENHGLPSKMQFLLQFSGVFRVILKKLSLWFDLNLNVIIKSKWLFFYLNPPLRRSSCLRPPCRPERCPPPPAPGAAAGAYPHTALPRPCPPLALQEVFPPPFLQGIGGAAALLAPAPAHTPTAAPPSGSRTLPRLRCGSRPPPWPALGGSSPPRPRWCSRSPGWPASGTRRSRRRTRHPLKYITHCIWIWTMDISLWIQHKYRAG